MFNCTKAKSLGKNEVRKNKHILAQMNNKKSSIELKSKTSPLCTFTLIRTNEHILVQMNKSIVIQTCF